MAQLPCVMYPIHDLAKARMPSITCPASGKSRIKSSAPKAAIRPAR